MTGAVPCDLEGDVTDGMVELNEDDGEPVVRGDCTVDDKGTVP